MVRAAALLAALVIVAGAGVAAIARAPGGGSGNGQPGAPPLALLRLRRVEVLEAFEGKALDAQQAALEALEARQQALLGGYEALEFQQRAIVVGLGPEFHPSWATASHKHLLALALAGLTGLKASIPITVICMASRLSEDFPLAPNKHFQWLESWQAIVALHVFLVLELVLDGLTGASTVMDYVMIVVKPLIGITIAAAPQYDEGVVAKIANAANAAVFTLLTALAKSSVTAAVNERTGGGWAPVRSALESVSVLALSLLSLVFIVGAPLVVAGCVALIGGWLVQLALRSARPGKAQPAEQ